MTLEVFSVYDRVAKNFLDPFFAPNAAFAMRTFSNCCKDKSHPFGKNPEDFALFKIGEFGQENGVVSPCEPDRIFTGTEAAAVASE